MAAASSKHKTSFKSHGGMKIVCFYRWGRGGVRGIFLFFGKRDFVSIITIRNQDGVASFNAEENSATEMMLMETN